MAIISYCLLDCLWDARLRQQPGPGPGRLGWLAWFKMLLAWGGGVGGGGEGVISCTPIITFHLVGRKEFYIYAFILTFRYASFGNEGIGKISYGCLDC